MVKTTNCRACKCATCTKQNTDKCPTYYESWCDVCEGTPEARADRYTAKSWKCKDYERRAPE